MYSLKNSNITVHQCHEKVPCSPPARERSLPRSEECPREASPPACSARRGRESPSRVAEQGFVFLQSVLHSSVDRQKQRKSRLLRLQVSRHIVTRHQRSRVALELLHALVPGSYLLTYKKK